MARVTRVRPILAGGYLFDALAAIRDAGMIETLYDRDIRRLPDGGAPDSAIESAARRRMSYSRTALLLSAFAAEAYVNEFAAARLPARDVEALDRVSTPEK